MKTIGVTLLFVCFAAASIDIHKSFQHPNAVNYDDKPIQEEATKEHHNVQQHNGVNEHESVHNHNIVNEKEHQAIQPHHKLHQSHSAETHLSNNRHHVKQEQQIEQHRAHQTHHSHVAEQLNDIDNHYSAQIHNNAPKGHNLHKSHLLRSHSVHKHRNYGADADTESFENEIVGMLKGIEAGKIK